MDQALNVQVTPSVAELPTIVATEAAIEKTVSSSEQDETGKDEKQVLIRPVSANSDTKSASLFAENSSYQKTSIDCTPAPQSEMSYNPYNPYSSTVSPNIPKLILNPSPTTTKPGQILRLSHSGLPGQVTRTLNSGLPEQLASPLIPGVPGHVTKTHNPGVPGQVNTRHNIGFPGQISNLSDSRVPGQISNHSDPRVPGQISASTNPGLLRQISIPTNPELPGQVSKQNSTRLPGQTSPLNNGDLSGQIPKISHHGLPGQIFNLSELGMSGQISTNNAGLLGQISTPAYTRLPGQTPKNPRQGQISTLPIIDFPGQISKITHGLPGQISTLPRPALPVHAFTHPNLKRASTMSSPGEYTPRPMLRLAPISSLSNQPTPLNAPPSMPPLLRLPTAPPVFSIPVSSSGPSKSMLHETPTQAAYANIPLLAPLISQGPPNSSAIVSQGPPNSSAIVELLHNSKHYVPPTPPAGSSPATFPCSLTGNSSASYSITLPGGSTTSYPLELPGDSSASVPYPLTLPGGSGSTDDTVVLSDNSSSSGDLTKDPNNAAKCREYRERSRAKKEQEIRDFQHHLTQNMKLKAAYDKKTDTIKKLKAYYIQCLQEKKYKCKDHQDEAGTSAASPASTLSTSSLPSTPVPSNSTIASETALRTDKSADCSPMPMVTIKSEEAELLIANVKSEVEDEPIL